jgi:hypothetical protein
MAPQCKTGALCFVGALFSFVFDLWFVSLAVFFVLGVPELGANVWP